METKVISPLGANLRRLRTKHKLTQSELADQSGLSREGYRRMEDGQVEPRLDSLRRIAGILGVRSEELLVPVRELTAVRFRAAKRMTTREDLLAKVSRWLEDYNDLEHLVGKSPDNRLEGPSREIRAYKDRDPRIAAAIARRALGLNERDSIRDICGLLEDHGVKIYSPPLASDGFFGLSVAAADGGPAVVVNRWERISVERWIFTAVHELGHLLLHLDAYDVVKTEEDEAQELEANMFAAQFLMPDELFDKEWEDARGLGLVDRVLKIKRIFHVSWKTVVHRIASRSDDSRRVWAQFYVAYKKQTGKALRGVDEPDPLGPEAFSQVFATTPIARIADEPEHLSPSDFVEDRLVRLVREGMESELLSLARGAEILDLSLKETRALVASWSA
ncbi:MAG: ImmA/IrrE family metallo-endopeptidase [Polyangiaceae bacterium]|nr:ImmA/IrrE family metallo-endopeptidase [Polyangiaceae bacterium]